MRKEKIDCWAERCIVQTCFGVALQDTRALGCLYSLLWYSFCQIYGGCSFLKRRNSESKIWLLLPIVVITWSRARRLKYIVYSFAFYHNDIHGYCGAPHSCVCSLYLWQCLSALDDRRVDSSKQQYKEQSSSIGHVPPSNFQWSKRKEENCNIYILLRWQGSDIHFTFF